MFHGLRGRDVVDRFDGGGITSDTGVVLLREVEQRRRILGCLSECFTDRRDPGPTGKPGSSDARRLTIVFLFYEPDVEKLKNLALSLPMARALPAGSRRKFVFAPTKYLDREFRHKYRIDFQQLPFQIHTAIETLEQ